NPLAAPLNRPVLRGRHGLRAARGSPLLRRTFPLELAPASGQMAACGCCLRSGVPVSAVPSGPRRAAACHLTSTIEAPPAGLEPATRCLEDRLRGYPQPWSNHKSAGQGHFSITAHV